MGLRAGKGVAATAASQRRAEVWKVRAAGEPLLVRARAPIESNRELILEVLLSKVVLSRG
jgi:hypothetical protein